MINLQTRSTFHTSSWLGELPSDWRFSKFKRHAWFKTGTTPPTDNQANYSEQGFPWLRPEDIIEGRIFAKASKFLSEEGLRYVSVSRGMATVICGIGTIGKIALVKNRFSSNQQLISIDSTFDNYFCYYLCLSARSEFESLSTGNVVRILNTERLGNLEVPVPPLGEQRQIAAYLNRETAKIDKLIAKQKKLIKLLQEKRQAVIGQAVTKGLDPNVKMKDSGVELLGEVPEHWSFGALKRFCKRIVVGIAEAATHAYVDEGVPILRATNVRENKLIGELLFVDPLFSQERNSKRLFKGDVVTVRTGAPGVSAVIPADLDSCQCFTMLITTPSNKWLNPHFTSYFLNSYSAKKYFSLEGWGSAQLNISVPILQNLMIAIPPIAEQLKIVEFIETQNTEIEALMTKVERATRLLVEHRQALITAAVTGKIDVRGLVTDAELVALDAEPEVETTEEDFASDMLEDTYITEEE